jgi:hypothetical protein
MRAVSTPGQCEPITIPRAMPRKIIASVAQAPTRRPKKYARLVIGALKKNGWMPTSKSCCTARPATEPITVMPVKPRTPTAIASALVPLIRILSPPKFTAAPRTAPPAAAVHRPATTA